MVSVLDFQLWSGGFKFPPGQIGSSMPPKVLTHSVIISTLTPDLFLGEWDGRESCLPSYAEAKKMKSLTLYAHGCLTGTVLLFFQCSVGT